MKISVVIMAHKDRAMQTFHLRQKLQYMKFTSVKVCVDHDNNEWENGKKAWRMHEGSDWAITIQDDAIISSTFEYNVRKALENIPEQTCLSFYTGTVRPFESRVTKAVKQAEKDSASYLSGNNLFWGVGFALPTKDIPVILDCVDVKRYEKLMYDHRIGMFFTARKQKVYYTNPSLLDHDDSLPSLTKHITDRPRIAHRYIGEDIVPEWNNTLVDIGI